MVGQAILGTLVSDNPNDNTDSQVVLGVANVHVDGHLADIASALTLQCYNFGSAHCAAVSKGCDIASACCIS